MKGYIPHPYQGAFKCDRCQGMVFTSYPQACPADRSKGWTYEYVCVNCGHMMGLTVRGDDDEEGEE